MKNQTPKKLNKPILFQLKRILLLCKFFFQTHDLELKPHMLTNLSLKDMFVYKLN